MRMVTTKMKCWVVVILSLILGLTIYWFIMKKRQNEVTQLQDFFVIPADQVHKHILANGMHVLIYRNTALPKVHVQIAYDVGSYVEESGERGLAHLVEHMIFKGTQELSESDIDSIARRYGATFNAFTSMDVTSYYFETNKNNWKPFVQLLADCMQNARFDAQHLASEVKAVIQELKMKRDNYWHTMIFKAFELIFPPNHPYHTPIIGFKEDLLGLSAENLKKFYKKYYRPDRATLFIIGDVDHDEALQMAQHYFEPIKAEEGSIIKPFPTIIPELMTNSTRYFEDIKKDQLGFYWVIPGLKYELEHIPSALESLLGQGQASRLVRLLVDEKKVATSVSVKASKFAQAGLFLILIDPMPGAIEQCQQLVQQELEKIMKEGVRQQEIDRVAKLKSRKFFGKMQNYTDFAYNWIKSYFSTQDPLDIFKRVHKYYQITSPQIQKFVQTYLDPFLMNRIEVLPLPEAKRLLQESIKKLSDEVDKKILARHVRTVPLEQPRMLHKLPLPAQLSFQFPKPTRVLDFPNGLRVLLTPRDLVPLITLNCQFKDAAFLADACDGIAVQFMMDMLMEGSKGATKKQNVDAFEQAGAAYSFDEGGARFSCLRHDFQTLAHCFYHILTQPTFPREAIEKLCQIFDENFQRAKDLPKLMAVRLLKNLLYKDHPFAWTYDQASDIVNKLDAKELAQLHATYVCPANMTLSVVGDFQIDTMTKILTDVFGTWPTGTRKEFTYDAHSFEKGTCVDHTMMRGQTVLLLGQPSTITIYDPDLVPLKLLNIICFRSLGSRIFQLREQTGLFYAAFGGWAANATKEHGFDFVGTIVNPENVATAETQIRHLLEEFAQHGVTQSEIDAARQIYLKDLIDLVTDNSAIARLLGILDSFELGFDYYDNVLNRIQTMTIDEVNTVASKYCLPQQMVRVRVGPALGKA